MIVFRQELWLVVVFYRRGKQKRCPRPRVAAVFGWSVCVISKLLIHFQTLKLVAPNMALF